MADLVEALQQLARERARGGPSPLVALRQFPARPGARISHLGVSQALAQAWVTVTGKPFRPHQSLALSALRRGEPLALMGGHGAHETLHLLGLELLRAEAPATALLIAPDELAAAYHKAALERLVQALGEPLRVGLAHGDDLRAAMTAQLLVATPEALHDRLLRHHDRAWSALWRRLRLIMLADAHSYDGLAVPHLGWLLRRAARLSGSASEPQLAASIAPVAGAELALAQLTGAAWRVIPADDGPTEAATLAFWRPGGERTRELVALALGLARAGAGVQVSCASFEAPLVNALVGDEQLAVRVGPSPLPARVQLLAGVAQAPARLRQCLESAELTVLLLGEDPAERTLARLAARDSEPLPGIEGPPPAWVVAPGNAYVSAAHLVCAAAEEPLQASEVDGWGVGSVVARIEAQRQLLRLPDGLLQPLPDGGDPYAGFELRSAGSAPARLSDDQGGQLGTLDIAAFDRWGFLGGALPPLRGGFRVIGRDDATLELRLRGVPEPRRTLPLRRCEVRVRDRREQRVVRGREVGWGRVMLDEEVYGFREAAPGSAPAERAISPPISTSLAASACWIDLASGVSATGQLAGWTLVAALPLRALSAVTDLVPAYDAEARRIYFVDAQPGGNGVAAWLFTHLEELLPCAYDIALDCRGDALLEPLARADTDWLLSLLAGGHVGASAPPRLTPVTSPAPRPQPPRPESPPARAEPARSEPPLVRVEPARPEPKRAELERVEPPLARVEPTHPEPKRSEPARPEPKRAEPARSEPPSTRAEPPLARTEPARPEPPSARAEPARSEPSRPEQAPPRPEPARREPQRPASARRGGASNRAAASRPGAQPGGPRREPPAAQPPLPLDPPAPAPPRRPAPVVPEPPVPEPPRRAAPAVPEAPPPDADAMVARLRRLREQREQRAPRTTRAAPHPAESPAESRFHTGDAIVCTPYGRGFVRSSRIEDERELLVVAFPDHGELTIDAAVSAARLDNDETPPADDDF